MLHDEAYGEECLYCHGGGGDDCPFCGDARRAAEEAERVALPVGAYELPEGVLERVQF